MLLQIYLADLDDNFHHLKSWSSGPGLIFFVISSVQRPSYQC